MQVAGIALGGESDEAGLALVAQCLERRDDIVHHLVEGDIGVVFGTARRVVQLEDIDMVQVQPLQAGFQRGPGRLPGVFQVFGSQAEFRADDDPLAAAAEDPAEIGFRGAIAIGRGCVEEVDAMVARWPGPSGRPWSSTRRPRRSRR